MQFRFESMHIRSRAAIVCVYLALAMHLYLFALQIGIFSVVLESCLEPGGDWLGKSAAIPLIAMNL